jgi:DNA-binding SARP family transcriptional activator/pimeloyl-ACP methyl ester carboxylesterase/tetratricopeptide (TPR) repeat protein
MCKLYLFGAPALECSGGSQPIPRRKARALLAYLAVTQQSHSREALVALFWPEYDHRSGRSDLSRILSSLRKTLGSDFFLTDRESVTLNREAGLWIDVHHFRKQLEACRTTADQDDDCHQKLTSALELYRADFLTGFTLPGCPDFDEWQLLQTEALRRDLGWVLEKLIHIHEARDDLAQAIDYARRWVGLDPLHEPAQRRLIALYASNGQLAEAHRQYRVCERLLTEELGVEPQPETKQLYERIRKSRPHTASVQSKKLEHEIRFFFSFDGVRIAYATVGEGPPLIMTATFLRHLEYDWQSPIWHHWLDALARSHTLIRYDERGCGLSDWNVSDISFEAWVRDLEALVENLGLERFRLLALSQAGAVALVYAARHPDKVSHLILHGAYARGRFQRVENLRAGEEAQTMLSLTRLGWGQDSPAFRQVFSLQLMPDATKEQLAWYDELMRVSMTPENAVRAEEVMYNINVVDRLPEIITPTLVTHCSYDEAVPFSEGRILASQIPGARFVPLASKNHLLLSGEPAWEQFTEEIHRFVATESPLPTGSLPASRAAAIQIPSIDWPERQPERLNPFVAREKELARLSGYLEEALAGNGQVVFVTGGAGRGKTSLLEESARRGHTAHPELIVAGGNGNAFAGVGDPYLPFRDVMALLTGDVSVSRTRGQMRIEQARRLWTLLPLTTQAILEYGPQLLDVFVSGKQLLARVRAAAPAGLDWVDELQREVTRRQDTPGSLEQSALFGQFTNVLHHLAQEHPLLITLDDLQWIDEASIGLLFHLGRRLDGSRILIIGAYRPDELPYGWNAEPHPLAQVLDEFKRIYGDVFIDLTQADREEGKALVEALLDTDPNQLDEVFRHTLFQRTEGHPLFTVELLRDMQERGDLVRDEAGRWCQGKKLDWKTFPARVEAVIARRVDRLDEASQAILSAASVEGELFTAEVVARVLGQDERVLLHTLSDQLSNRHRLVRERAEIKAGKEYLSLYQFSHALFQEYVYGRLPAGERRLLHKAVAEALVELYAGELDQVVAQLADHYSAAGDWGHAVHYHIQAGDLAFQKASLPDAVRHYRSALAHWLPDDENGRAEILRKLGECQWVLGQHHEAIETLRASHDLFQRLGDNQGAAATQRLLGRVYWESGKRDKASLSFQRALAITELEPESEERAWALAGMSTYQMQIENWDESIRLGEQALVLARRLGADELVLQCLCDLGSALSSKGDWDGLAMEKEGLELALALNRPHDAGRGYLYFGEGLLYLGDYEQARDIFEQAIVYTRRMNVPYITDAAVRMLAEVEWLTGDWLSALARLKSLNEKAGRGELAGTPRIYLGMTLGRIYNDLGQVEIAQRLLTEALAAVGSSSTRVALLGEMLRSEVELGHPDAVVAKVAEILDWAEHASYLFPNINMALLYVCSLPGAFGLTDMVDAARTAWEQLKRLEGQYRTQAIAACRLEGQGWLTLAEAESSTEFTYFERAAVRWQDLGHPYDQARALTGLGQALTQADNDAGARAALGQAKALVDSLAAQLEDPLLKASFQKSALVRKIRSGRIHRGE